MMIKPKSAILFGKLLRKAGNEHQSVATYLVNYPERLEIETPVRVGLETHPDATLVYHFVLALARQCQGLQTRYF